MSKKSSIYASLFTKIDDLQEKIKKRRPLSPEMAATLQEKMRVEWTYHSNAIEGNTLTLGETMFFLREGLTSEGRPLKDYLEARNHAEAIDALYDFIQGGRELTEHLIKTLHGILLKGIDFTYAKNQHGQLIQKALHAGQYKVQPNHVLTLTGEIHHYTDPLKVRDEMEALLHWYQNAKKMHPVEKAAIFHYRFAAIHPFDDGNGRMARLLMNLILIKEGYPPCIIQNSQRRKYLETLALVDADHDYAPFILWLGEILLTTQEQMLSVLSAKQPTAAGRPTGMNEIQRDELILQTIRSDGPLSVGQISEALPSIKRPTLKKDLKRLVESKRLKQRGIGKGVLYY